MNAPPKVVPVTRSASHALFCRAYAETMSWDDSARAFLDNIQRAVHRRVPETLEVVEKVGDLAREDRPQLERSKHVVERDDARRQQAMARRHLLGDQLAKLAKLDQRRRRVVEKISLCQHAETREALVLPARKSKLLDTPIGGNLLACPKSSKQVPREVSRTSRSRGSSTR
jgi:hypothetical protein